MFTNKYKFLIENSQPQINKEGEMYNSTELFSQIRIVAGDFNEALTMKRPALM